MEELELGLTTEQLREFKEKALAEIGEHLKEGFACTEGVSEKLFFQLQTQIDNAIARFS